MSKPFLLPLEAAPSASIAPAKQSSIDGPPVSPVAEGGIVLVVEDERSNRSLMGRMLLTLG